MIITRAEWIRATEDNDAPVFFKKFTLPLAPVSAPLEICGLGYFELTVNGERVTRDRLIPADSVYEKRALEKMLYPVRDVFTHRAYYLEYELTRYLKAGENVIEVHCGNGWYNQRERVIEGDVNYGGRPKLRFACDVTLRGGRVLAVDTDGSELWSPSHIVYSNIFIGEIIDASRYRAFDFKPVEEAPETDTLMTPSDGADDAVIREIKPKLVSDRNGTRIYDAGENITGVVRAEAWGRHGGRLVLRFGELLDGDGNVDFRTTGSAYTCGGGEKQIQRDEFILDGGAFTFEPKFVWHAFRYIEMTGDADAILTVLVIHSKVPVTSEFVCSDTTLNWYYDAYIRTQLDNMHGSHPSDCPHRERLGYTGDGQLCAESAMLTLGARDFYRKWIRDIADCQDRETGHTHHTSPYMGGGGSPGAWGGAIVAVPYMYWRIYGDRDMIDNYYEDMFSYCVYMTAHSDGDLVSNEEGCYDGISFLGDWLTVGNPVLPPDFVNTCTFIRLLRYMCEMSDELGRDDSARLNKLASRYRAALRAKYFDSETGSCFGGVQGADAFALDAGIGDDRTFGNLIARYRETGCIDTGFIGTPLLIETLCSRGYTGLAVKLLTAQNENSFWNMKQFGATTLWETWNYVPDGSMCHPAFGACVAYLYRYILGIKPLGAGYERVAITPELPDGIEFARGKITTPHGVLSVNARKTPSGVEITVDADGDFAGYIEYNGSRAILLRGRNTLNV